MNNVSITAAQRAWVTTFSAAITLLTIVVLGLLG
ncbi:hypothetical protein H4W30_003097 [Amycolatopsis roodepoortensis]|uniref:Uncharacterized protein n=1 Tax=Amycolatopsis roodepoortensis TaxID=700274 RepID=A0ABR9L630_9PSEU|nr:hypothetical protein [Amycolatopsis roodepoortensis]